MELRRDCLDEIKPGAIPVLYFRPAMAALITYWTIDACMAKVDKTGIEWTSLQGRQIITAFVTGALLSVLLVVAGVYLNPEEAAEFTAGRYQLLFAALFIGVSTGHYIGISLGEKPDVNVAAAVGAFLTISIAFVWMTATSGGLSELAGPGGVLVISAFLMIGGHYSLLIAENRGIERLIEQFAERFSPALLGIMWLVEALLPPVLSAIFAEIGVTEISNAALSGLKIGIAIIVVGIAIKVIDDLT